jgi:hypothetical protein
MRAPLAKLFIVLGTVGIYASALHAQSYRMQADVPFAYYVDDTAFPAGKCLVGRAAETQVQFLQGPTNNRVFIAQQPYYTNKGHARLVFHRYGDQYFLAEVWNPEGSGSKLPIGKRERELRDKPKSSEMASVTMNLASIR